MSSPSQPTHRISGPTELLAALPYLLGFHPAQSLVAVAVDSGMLGATARLDLADALEPGLVEHTVQALCRSGADRLVVVVLDDRCELSATQVGADRPWAEAIVAVERAAVQVGAELGEALFVCCGRWWSYLCSAERCCPVDGRPLADTPTAFAAASAYDGVVALPNREALAATLEPLPDLRRAELEPHLADAEDSMVAAVLDDRAVQHERGLVRELLRTARASTAVGWSPPDAGVLARLVAALAVITVRDQVWMAVDSRTLDGRPLWTELARRSPAPYDAAPMFLFAWASWRTGSGALAAMAAERVLISDPTYSAADLLLAALSQAVDPRTFPRLADAGFSPGVRARSRRGRRAGATRTLR